jgi:hypothetical protein
MNKRRLVTDKNKGVHIPETVYNSTIVTENTVGKSIMHRHVVGTLFIGLGLIMLTIVGLQIKDLSERHAGLVEACDSLGGIYIDDHTCVAGKNLFGGK